MSIDKWLGFTGKELGLSERLPLGTLGTCMSSSYLDTLSGTGARISVALQAHLVSV